MSISAQSPDAFALGGNKWADLPPDAATDDVEIVALFRRWIEMHDGMDARSGCGDDDPVYDGLLAELVDIENRIAAIPCFGPAAAAAQIYLMLWHKHQAPHPRKAALSVDFDEYDFDLEHSLVVNVLRHAARALPEIKELAEDLLHPDAELIFADRRIDRCRYSDDKSNAAENKERQQRVARRLEAALRCVWEVEATTDRGAQIKARHPDPLAELRRECVAIAADYRAPLPEGDEGLVEAVRRWCELQPRSSSSSEYEIVEIAYAARRELGDRIRTWPVAGMRGAAAMLQYAIEVGKGGSYLEFSSLVPVLKVIEGQQQPLRRDGGDTQSFLALTL